MTKIVRRNPISTMQNTQESMRYCCYCDHKAAVYILVCLLTLFHGMWLESCQQSWCSTPFHFDVLDQSFCQAGNSEKYVVMLVLLISQWLHKKLKTCISGKILLPWNIWHEEECHNLANRLNKPVAYVSCVQFLCNLQSLLNWCFESSEV